MSSSRRTIVVNEPADGPSLAFRSWPLVHEPAVGWAVLGLVLLVAVLAQLVAGSVPMTLLVLAATLAAFRRVFIPVRFDVNYSRVARQSLLGRRIEVRWSECGTFKTTSQGIVLLPNVEGPAIEYLRAIFIPWGPDPDALLAIVKHKVPCEDQP